MVISSLLLLLLTGVGLGVLIRPHIRLQIGAVTTESADAYRAAALWALSFLIFVAASIWSALLAARILKRYCSSIRVRIFAVCSAGLAALVALIINRTYTRNDAPLALVANADVPISAVTAIGNSIAAGVVIFTIASVFALLRRPASLSMRELRERTHYAQLSLYSAAIFLIAGVVEIYFLHDWPAHIYVGAPTDLDRNSLSAIAKTVGIVAGAMYSLILLITYVPLMVVQERWVQAAAESATNVADGDLVKWRTTQMVTRSLASTFSQILAVASPLLAAIGIPSLPTGG